MTRWNRISVVLVVMATSFTAACGGSVTVPKPTPSVSVSKKATGSLELDLSSFTDATVCSNQEGLPELCVDGFRSAFEESLQAMLTGFVEPGAGDTYKATFKLLALTHEPEDGEDAKAGSETARLSLRWKFTLAGPSGQPIAALAETTEGPESIGDWSNAEPAVGALVNAVLDKIGTVLGAASWGGA